MLSMSKVKKDLIIGLIIGVMATVFVYQAYGIQKLRPHLIQNSNELRVLLSTVFQLVDLINQSTIETAS